MEHIENATLYRIRFFEIEEVEITMDQHKRNIRSILQVIHKKKWYNFKIFNQFRLVMFHFPISSARTIVDSSNFRLKFNNCVD